MSNQYTREIAVTGGEGGKIVGDQSCLIVVVDMI